MKLCVLAGMINAKLSSKIAPLQAASQVTDIFLIRRQTYQGDKIRCFAPPPWLGWARPLGELWRLTALIYVLIRHRPQWIIAFGIIPHGLYAWIFGKIFRIPVIQHVMGKNDLRLTFPNQSGRKLALAALKASRYVAVRGQASIEYLVHKGIPKERLFAPQNLHDFALFQPDPRIRKRFDLIYVGLFSAYKRLDLVLDALKQVIHDHPNANVLLVGDGPKRKALEKQALRLGIQSHVEFLGSQTFDQLPTCYNAARVFIMTSQGEGLPMAMIEAMSCGLPVIVPADADITEIARNGINSVVVNEWTPRCFAEAIHSLLSDPARYQRLREGALRLREHKAREYSLAAQTELWEGYLYSKR